MLQILRPSPPNRHFDEVYLNSYLLTFHGAFEMNPALSTIIVKTVREKPGLDHHGSVCIRQPLIRLVFFQMRLTKCFQIFKSKFCFHLFREEKNSSMSVFINVHYKKCCLRTDASFKKSFYHVDDEVKLE